MLTLPKISFAQTSIAAFLFLAFTYNPQIVEKDCATAEPFTVVISGFFVTGHVCGNSDLKIPHHLSFKLQADDIQQPIILKQLTGFSGKSHSDAENFHD